MSAIRDIWRAFVARVRAIRQDRCLHDRKREGEPFLRPGQNNWLNAEQLYRCRKCGATYQDGIF